MKISRPTRRNSLGTTGGRSKSRTTHIDQNKQHRGVYGMVREGSPPSRWKTFPSRCAGVCVVFCAIAPRERWRAFRRGNAVRRGSQVVCPRTVFILDGKTSVGFIAYTEWYKNRDLNCWRRVPPRLECQWDGAPHQNGTMYDGPPKFLMCRHVDVQFTPTPLRVDIHRAE